MAISTDELGVLVRSNLADSFLRRATRAVFQASKLSWDEAYAGHQAEEAQNLQPYLKRAKLEGFLRDAAAMEVGMAGSAIKSDGPWFHTEIQSGPVILTASAAPTPCALIHPAHFRITLAEGNQPSLFEESEADSELATACYVSLVHTRYHPTDASDWREHGYLPGSAYLAVPAPGIKSYLWELNLFEAFPDVVAQHVPNEWSTEALLSYSHKAKRATWAA